MYHKALKASYFLCQIMKAWYFYSVYLKDTSSLFRDLFTLISELQLIKQSKQSLTFSRERTCLSIVRFYKIFNPNVLAFIILFRKPALNDETTMDG